RAEGKHLVAELRERLARIAGQVEQVRGLAASLRPVFARRLETRLRELLGGTAIDQARLAQEAALLAERSDISEELDRLRSHLQQFTKLLDGAGELGKKLDFLLQEMHREANTMPSISCTTRPRRATESSGKCYDFVSEAEFDAMVARGEFLEYARVFGKHSYGTPKKWLEESRKKGLDLVLEIDVQGAAQVKE